MKKNMINKLIVALALLASTMTLGSCDSMSNISNGFLLDVTISGPGVSNHEVTLEMGKTLQLSAQEILGGTSDMVWRSYDESVATVDKKSGLVTPVAPGRVRITAYTDTKDFANGDYVFITVVGASISVVPDAIDQSLAD